MRPSATDYRVKAAQMRKFAEEETNAEARQKLLNVALEYEKLVARAEARKTKS
jgi:hypothetical protein